MFYTDSRGLNLRMNGCQRSWGFSGVLEDKIYRNVHTVYIVKDTYWYCVHRYPGPFGRNESLPNQIVRAGGGNRCCFCRLYLSFAGFPKLMSGIDKLPGEQSQSPGKEGKKPVSPLVWKDLGPITLGAWVFAWFCLWSGVAMRRWGSRHRARGGFRVWLAYYGSGPWCLFGICSFALVWLWWPLLFWHL